jgi:hypothetical protein
MIGEAAAGSTKKTRKRVEAGAKPVSAPIFHDAPADGRRTP